jgi:LytS/YehU family sensor histidine kinase
MEPDYSRAFLDASMQVITTVCLSYFNYFVLLPTFLRNKKWFNFFLSMTVSLALIVMLQLWLKREIYEGVSEGKFNFITSSKFVYQHISTIIFLVTFVSMLRFLKDWFELEAKRKEIENEKLMTELRFLKEQINPHFLFNTLNNLYYLAHTNSPNTKEVIAKLSQMMRYMIYEANSEKVPVSKEIEYIENYIALEKLRLEDDFPLEISIKGDYSRLQIAPLIFITFLENAFKHGTNHGDKESWVKVAFDFKDNHCKYTVSNSKGEKSSDAEKSGIGLKNTKRRLNLSYENLHTLEILEDENVFEIKLEIDL